MRRDAGGVTPRLHEFPLKLFGVDASTFRVLRIPWMRCHDLRPLLVEVDKTLGYRVALDGISVKQFGLRPSFDDGDELPTEVERVLHRNVHALARLRAVRMARVARDEDARQA